MNIPSVALLATRYPDLSIEESILTPAGVSVVREDGSDPASAAAVAGVDVVIAGSRATFDRSVLEALGIRGIVRAGIGVDRIDLVAADALGVQVSNVPDYGTESVAQHALAMALAGNRRLLEADRNVRDGRWGFPELQPLYVPGSQTAGVLGLGRIGRRVAELFRAVGFGRVIGHDPHVEIAGVEQVTFDQLLGSADVLSLHVPGGAEPVLGRSQLELMPEGAVLVNTARGALIDETALAGALATGRPRVACLDVFGTEPPDLRGFAGIADRLIVSPHQAWYTEESQRDLRRKASEEALRIIHGETRKYPVNQPESAR